MRTLIHCAALCFAMGFAVEADAATMPSSGPNPAWTESQKFEWYLGYMSDAASICRDYAAATQLAEVANLSPYGRIGLSAVGVDGFNGAACGRIRGRVKELLQKRETYIRYLTEKYDCSPDGECLEPGVDPLASNHSCSSQVDKALERLNVSRSDVARITVKSETGHLYGNTPAHQAQVKLKNCEGTLFLDMSEQCRVKQSYTRGDCEIAGVSAY